MSETSTRILIQATTAILGILVLQSLRRGSIRQASPIERKKNREESGPNAKPAEDEFSVLPCIRHRQSIFPNQYLKNPPPLDPKIVQSLLEAALWGPFHGKRYAGCQHPARFVVLGPESMVEMQEMTLKYYDTHWKSHWNSLDDYQEWRLRTAEEVTGRWGPCTHMIAIIMRRQAGPKRFPEWEEAAAVAAAVQNMHIQSTKFPQLACYWSSWHDAARDSAEMNEFLEMGNEDKCLGFFMVAQRKNKHSMKDRRKRESSLLAFEWRK